MIIASILAGGSGVRMGNPNKPKQFLSIGDKPILVHTIEKFCACGSFDIVLVLTPVAWVKQTEDIIAKYCPRYIEKIVVIAGGQDRNDTIMNAIRYSLDHFEIDDSSIIVTHDAVRPFVTVRIIEENIRAAERYGACDTVIPATDTIVESVNANTVTSIPNRNFLYQGQTPQSFKLLDLWETLESLSIEEKKTLTDACKAYVLRGKEVYLVRGDVSNIKVTYPQDLRIAEAMIGD